MKTTISDKGAPCPQDKVNRQFAADRPNRLWVSDFSYVATWRGFVYVAFVIDVYARRIVGWRASRTADAGFALDALEQALHDRRPLDAMIRAIVDELAPELIARNSIGHNGAAQLLLTAGENSERLRSEASFAALCGVSPVPASSGKTIRHRLNRGGDRAANSALHIIAIGRLRTDTATKAYVAKRIAEGHSKLDAIRALKRYIAREVFHIITRRRREINRTRIAA